MKRLSKIYTNKELKPFLDKGYSVETAENMIALCDTVIMYVAAQAIEDRLRPDGGIQF